MPLASGPAVQEGLLGFQPGSTRGRRFLLFGDSLLGGLGHPVLLVMIFLWLFALAIFLGSALAVVRHAERLAARLGEPYGTLLLTRNGHLHRGRKHLRRRAPRANIRAWRGFAADAVVMIILNGMVGLSLLLGNGVSRAAIQSSGLQRFICRHRHPGRADADPGFHSRPRQVDPVARQEMVPHALVQTGLYGMFLTQCRPAGIAASSTSPTSTKKARRFNRRRAPRS